MDIFYDLIAESMASDKPGNICQSGIMRPGSIANGLKIMGYPYSNGDVEKALEILSDIGVFRETELKGHVAYKLSSFNKETFLNLFHMYPSSDSV